MVCFKGNSSGGKVPDNILNTGQYSKGCTEIWLISNLFYMAQYSPARLRNNGNPSLFIWNVINEAWYSKSGRKTTINIWLNGTRIQKYLDMIILYNFLDPEPGKMEQHQNGDFRRRQFCWMISSCWLTWWGQRGWYSSSYRVTTVVAKSESPVEDGAKKKS